jgi:small subunit ribosomal protein S20
MPIKQSAQKALRQSKKRTARNMAAKFAATKMVKELKKKLETKDKTGALELLPKAVQALDKAAKIGVLTRNAASRRKSKLQRAVNKIA